MPNFPKQFLLPLGPMVYRDASRSVAFLDQRPPPGEAVITDKVIERLHAAGIVVEDENANHGPDLIWFRSVQQQGEIDPGALEGALRRKLRWVAPVYRLEGVSEPEGLFCARPDTFLLRDRSNNSEDQAKAGISALGAVHQVEHSIYLAHWQYALLPQPHRRTSFDVYDSLANLLPGVEFAFECVPFLSPLAATPSDPLFGQQWGMVRIGAPAAWDLTRGDPTVVVAVIDSGCNLTHPDLSHAYVSAGFNAGDPTLDGSAISFAMTGRHAWHGTAVTGVIAAGFDNDTGLAGLAGECGILPVAIPTGSTVETAIAVRRAFMEGATVLNLSWAIGSVFFEMHTRAAVDEALTAGCIICAAAGNYDGSTLALPAGFPGVMACGGSDEGDIRWRDPATGTGSHYGDEIRYGSATGISVVAPAINITTTDHVGPDGFASAASPGGDYITSTPAIPAYFQATSAATPHVSGAMALISSLYPALSAVVMRRVIERTAEKVGGYSYRDATDYPNGTRHPEMGYGRLNVARALDLGDVMIRDWWADDGIEPSRPPGGNYYSFSDIVIRPTDDGVFEPRDPMLASVIEPGTDHTITVRVQNIGPAAARNVRCEVRATPWAGVHFVYPNDWTLADPLHVPATPIDGPITTLAAGDEGFLRFSLTAAQIDMLAGWTDLRWHPCLLAVVRADNDFPFADAPGGPAMQMRRNNLAQRNLTVGRVAEGETLESPLVIGHPDDKVVRFRLEVGTDVVGRGGSVHLLIDDDQRSFPVLRRHGGLGTDDLKISGISGGEAITLNGRRAIQMVGAKMIVELKAPRPGRHALILSMTPPPGLNADDEFYTTVFQRVPDGRVTGGVTVVMKPGAGD